MRNTLILGATLAAAIALPAMAQTPGSAALGGPLGASTMPGSPPRSATMPAVTPPPAAAMPGMTPGMTMRQSSPPGAAGGAAPYDPVGAAATGSTTDTAATAAGAWRNGTPGSTTSPGLSTTSPSMAYPR